MERVPYVRHKKLRTVIDFVIQKKIASQIFFFLILAFTIGTSFYIKNPFVKFSQVKLFFSFMKSLIFPFFLFLLCVNFILPEISSLFHVKISWKKDFWKNSYLLFIFYVVSGILLMPLATKTIGWLTSTEIFGTDVSLIYAGLATPCVIFLVRKSGSNSIFDAVMYSNIYLILFFVILEVTVTGWMTVYNQFLDTLLVIWFPTLMFVLLDILIPQEKIRGLLR